MSTPACLPPAPAARPDKPRLVVLPANSGSLHLLQNGCCVAGVGVKLAHPYLHLEPRRHDMDYISHMRTATEEEGRGLRHYIARRCMMSSGGRSALIGWREKMQLCTFSKIFFLNIPSSFLKTLS